MNCKTLIIYGFILFQFKSISQTTVPNNVRVPAAFLGWNGAGPFPGPLDVRNNFNNHIAFFTAGPNNTRMRIFGNGLSSSCPQGGGVGINPNPANPILAPGSFLHIGTTVPTLNNTSIGVFGWRNWMQLGTFMYDATDNM